MQRQFKKLPYHWMTVQISAVDGNFSRGLAQEVFKLSYEIIT